MYINLWSYESYEAAPLEYRDHTMIFVGDTPAGTKVECGYCHKELVLVPNIESCPHCDGNLIYGRVDW